MTIEHHEQQQRVDAAQDAASMLELQVGDHLLLPQGSRTILCKVRAVDTAYVTVQYYAQDPEKKKKPSAMECLELVWWRQRPSTPSSAVDKLLAPDLNKMQVKAGFEPWQEKLHVNLFYQRVVKEEDLKRSKNGVEVKALRLAAVMKAKPLVPQSDAIGTETAVDVAVNPSNEAKSKRIEATDKTPKAAHIRRRVQLVAGKTVKQALKLQVPDKNGDLTQYKKKDFKYDVKAGFLRF